MALIPVLVGTGTVYSRSNPVEATAANPVWQAAPVYWDAIPSVINATGSIVPYRQSTLSFDLPGTVVELPVSEGQQVEAGQLLAREDDSTQQFNLQQANFAVQAAQSALDKLLEPVDARLISNAEAQVKAAEGAYSAKASAVGQGTINTLQLQYQQSLSGVQDANKLRDDAGGQYATNDPNYLRAVAQVGIAQNNADIAQLKLQQAQQGVSLESATANIAYAQANLVQLKIGPPELAIETAQAQLAIATIQRDQAQHVLDKAHLVAPFAGTLTKVIIKQGQVTNGAAFILTDDRTPFVDVQVSEVNIGMIQIGQPVTMSLTALPGTMLTGKVQRIDTIATSTTPVVTYTVRIALDATRAPIKVDMTVNVTFGTSARPGNAGQ
jgi:multidrug efflux pump subunit AcrA (membrane-fusion protein)